MKCVPIRGNASLQSKANMVPRRGAAVIARAARDKHDRAHWGSDRTPKEHILGLHRRLNPEGLSDQPQAMQDSFMELRELVSKSIEVSTEMYSSNAHFLLELVQNADDNTYPADCVPTLKIQVERHQAHDLIVLRNNERGFTPADVEAICRIGESTKSKAQGYIGEKGIGFKSTFKPADKVYISSNGYSFSLDSGRKAGEIDPQWEDEPPIAVDLDWTTIVMTLKHNIDRQGLEQQCADLHPFLLLFLKKLRRLEVTACGVTKVYELKRKGQAVTITVTRSTGRSAMTHRFYVHTTTISMPEHLRVKPRAGVAATDLVLAFPLDANGAALASSSQMVHAFLPVLDYGFRFLIQADFIVPSSREAIDEDSPWNKQLQQQLASAFQQALLSMQQLPALRASFLNYVPLAGQVSGTFFRQLALTMLQDTCKAAMFLTADGQGTHAARVLQPNDSFTYGPEQTPLVSNARLLAACGKRFLHADMAAAVPISTLQALHCQLFGFGDLVRCAKQGSGGVRDPSWFKGLYAVLRQHGLVSYRNSGRYTSEVLALRDAHIFLLQQGSTSTAKGVCLPCTNMSRFKELLPAASDAVKLLDERSFDPVADLQLLGAWGIKPLSEEGVLVPAVLDQYKPASPALSTQQHLDHVRFMYEHRHNAAVMLKAQAQLKLRTEDGSWAAAACIYISTTGDGWSLQALLSSGTFLGPQYSELSDAEQEWLQSGLSVAAMPRIDAATGQLSAEFRALLSQPGRSEELLCMLRDCYGCYMQQLRQGGGQAAQAAFIQALQGMQVLDSEGVHHTLSDCYLATKAVKSLMGASTPCVEVPDPDSPSYVFLSDLGVSREANVAAYLKRLQQLSAANGVVATDTVVAMYSFLGSQFAAYGADICRAFDAAPLIYLPAESSTGSSSLLRVAGSHAWVRLSDVLWKGDGKIFKQQAFLADVDVYKQLERFFVHCLGVRDAGLQDLRSALLDRASKAPAAMTEEDKKVVCSIYKELSRWVDDDDDSNEARTAVTALLQQPVLLVRRDGKPAGWSAADGSVYMCSSSGQVEREFGAGLKVLDVHANQIKLLQGFVSCAEGGNAIRDIADELQEEWVWDKESQELLEDYVDELQQAAPLLARCLYHTDTKQCMEQLKRGELRRLSRGLRVYAVSGLHRVRSFQGIQSTEPQLVAYERTSDGQLHLFVSQEALQSDEGADRMRMQLRVLYSNLWSGSSEFHKLARVVLFVSPSDAQFFLDISGISELPPEMSSLDPSCYGSIHMGLSKTERKTAHHHKSSAGRDIGSDWAGSMGSASTAGNASGARTGNGSGADAGGSQKAGSANGSAAAEEPPLGFDALSNALLERQQAVLDAVNAAPDINWADLVKQPESAHQHSSSLPPRAMGGSIPVEKMYETAAGTAEGMGTHDGPGKREKKQTRGKASGPSASGSPITDDIGYLGEVYVYEQLRKLLPDFGPDNWTSAARCRYGLGDDYRDAGADFVYNDVYGLLTEGTAMEATAPKCFIEVKTTTGDGSTGFYMSNREWQVACGLNWEASGRDIPALYMVVRVAGINRRPHIHCVLMDPAGMMARGELRLTGTNLMIEDFG